MILSLNEKLSKEENFAMFAALVRCGHERADVCCEINTLLYGSISKFVETYLYQRFPSFCRNPAVKDDLLQTVWEEIYSVFYKYDGKNTLTTFVKCYILSGARRFISFLYESSYHMVKNKQNIQKFSCNNFDMFCHSPYFYTENSDLPEQPLSILALQSLDQYESRLFALYSGLIPGFYGKRYTVRMICVDPVLIDLLKKRKKSCLVDTNFTYPVFVNDHYELKTQTVFHVKPAFVAYEITRIRKKLQKMLC